MKNILSRFFFPEVYIEVIHAYLHKLPKEITVAFKKEDNFIIGEILLEKGADPIYIQAHTPAEFTKMVNEAVYIALDFKNEYIKFFHKKGDLFMPTPEAQKALDCLSSKSTVPKSASVGFDRVFGFESKIKEKEFAFA